MTHEAESKALLPHECDALPEGVKPDDIVPGSPSGRTWAQQLFVNHASGRWRLQGVSGTGTGKREL